MSQRTDGPSAEEDARSRPGAAGALVPPLPRLGGGSFPKSSSEGAPGDGGDGARVTPEEKQRAVASATSLEFVW